MILYNRKAVNQTVMLNGKPVKFVACKAEVSDEFGIEVLKLGIPDIYEDGKQPAFETPREVRIKSEFQDKELFYQREIAKYKNMVESYKSQLKTAQADAALWRAEYEKEHNLRIQLIEDAQNVSEVAAEAAASSAPSDSDIAESKEENGIGQEVEALRKDLFAMKKDELIAFGKESGLDMSSVEGLTKKEIVDYILSEK